jgi:hypothetical protein
MVLSSSGPNHSKFLCVIVFINFIGQTRLALILRIRRVSRLKFISDRFHIHIDAIIIFLWLLDHQWYLDGRLLHTKLR